MGELASVTVTRVCPVPPRWSSQARDLHNVCVRLQKISASQIS